MDLGWHPIDPSDDARGVRPCTVPKQHGAEATLKSVALALALAACSEPLIDPGDVTVTSLGTVGATEGWALNYPKQPKLFVALGRLWVFYADGVNMVVRTTTDGVTLTEPSVVWERMVFGHRCTFAFDGTFFHAVCSEALPGADVLYRRGEPFADGSIAWGPESVVFDVGPEESVLYPKVIVPADRQPWAAWMLFTGGFETAPQAAMVARSTRTDRTWETGAGFPFTLTTSTETFPDPLGVGLADGAVYWIYDLDGDATYRGRLYRGGAWGPEEEVGHQPGRDGLYSATADGGTVHVAYRAGGVFHRWRDGSGRWSEPTPITSFGSGHTSIARRGGGRVRITWLDQTTNRVGARTVGPLGAEPAELLLDAAPRGGLAGRLGINLNGLESPAAPFGEAIAVTVGGAPPYELLLVTRP